MWTRGHGFWVWGLASIVLAGCPGNDTPEASDTEGETETGTGGDTGETTSGSSASMTSVSSTAAGSASASGTSTSSTTSTSGVDTGGTGDTGTLDTTAGTGGCPPGTEDCPCDIGSTCEGDLECLDGTCVGQQACNNPEGEPNDEEADAVELDTATCNEDPIVVDAALEGVEDDWFTFEGQPSMFNCFSGGTPAATATPDQGTLEVCMFIGCTGGDPGNVSFCPMNGQSADSPEGLHGCCGDGGASLGGESCGFQNGDPFFLVRVHGGEENACTPYELAYDYTGL